MLVPEQKLFSCQSRNEIVPLFQKGFIKKLGHLLADKDSYVTGEVRVNGEKNGIENNLHKRKLDGPKDVEMVDDNDSGETSVTNGNGVWIFNNVYCILYSTVIYYLHNETSSHMWRVRGTLIQTQAVQAYTT